MTAYDWKDRVVLVTGGTRGIGLETALGFARAGAKTVLTYRWGGSEEAAAARFTAEGLPAPRILCADVGRDEDTVRLMETLHGEFERIDGFISNVSVASLVRGMVDYKLKGLLRSIELTSWPMVSYCQRIHDRFGAWPRYVVALSSLGTRQLAMNYDFVAASKAVLETLIPYLGWRLRPEGVRVNGVTCGLVQTESALAMAGSEFEAFQAWHNAAIGPIPFVPAADVAAAIFGLCSGWMDAINGQILTVDDGTWTLAEGRYGLFRASLANKAPDPKEEP